jgi:hypothetical protein
MVCAVVAGRLCGVLENDSQALMVFDDRDLEVEPFVLEI